MKNTVLHIVILLTCFKYKHKQQIRLKNQNLEELVVSASRISENILRSPISIEQLKAKDARLMGTPSFLMRLSI